MLKEYTGFTYKDMIGWEKERAAHRAQRISVVFEKRNDSSSAKKWTGWKIGNLRPLFEPILWFTKPYKIGGTIADNVLQCATSSMIYLRLKNIRLNQWRRAARNVLQKTPPPRTTRRSA
jgi:hypothetical protein